MYLVGHALVAFLLALGIAKKLNVRGISFALVMLIASLPDVDVLLESAGIIGHKSFTHSLILSTVVVPSVIFAIARWRNVSSAAAFIYSLAYVQHIAIGDIVVGSTNVLYPFGQLMIGSGIGYGTMSHQMLEFVLVGVASAIVARKSFKERVLSDTIFQYNDIDKICYLLIVASLIISFGYLLYGINTLPRLFIETDLEIAILILLHMSAAALISFLAFASRQHSILTSKENAVTSRGENSFSEGS